MSEDKCALTGNRGTFVKCHLYPRSFYKDMSDPAALKLILGDAPYKRSPMGVYDDALVIAETEQWFAQLDDLAFKFLKPFEPVSELLKRSSNPLTDGDRTIACHFEKYDFEGLALFFYSVLWRFAASDRQEAKGVTLGPFADAVGDILVQRKVPDRTPLGIIVTKVSDGDRLPIVFPSRGKIAGVNVVSMMFGGFYVWIKTDRRKYESPMDEIEMRRDRPLALMIWPFMGSAQYPKLVDVVRRASAKYGNPWRRDG